MVYKEIQVPNGTVRTIYEDFLKQVKPLAVQQELKNEQQAEINKAHRIEEKKLKVQYRTLSGDNYDPYLGIYSESYEQYGFGVSYTTIEALTDAETMLNAVRFSDGDVTMTVDQVEYMERIRNGTRLTAIQKDVEKPVKHPPSFWQAQIDRLLEKQPVKPAPAPATTVQVDPEEESGSFAGALVGLIALVALVVALLKACGG